MFSFRLSNTLDASFCIEALEEALERYGAPEIMNTDQGAQFNSEGFTGVLRAHHVNISMDGRGRWQDNVFIERLWRSVKYEEVYLKAYENIPEARQGLTAYFDLYNTRRRHQGLGGRTPDEFYWSSMRGPAVVKVDYSIIISRSVCVVEENRPTGHASIRTLLLSPLKARCTLGFDRRRRCNLHFGLARQATDRGLSETISAVASARAVGLLGCPR